MLLCYEGTNRQVIVATETDVGAQYEGLRT